MNNEEYALIVAKKIENLKKEIKKNNNILKIFPKESSEYTKAMQQLELLEQEKKQLNEMLYLPLIKRISNLSEVELNTYKEEQRKIINNKISNLESQLNNLQEESKLIDESLNSIILNLTDDDSEIEKVKEEVLKKKNKQNEIAQEKEKLKEKIEQLKLDLEKIQEMTIVQLKDKLKKKLDISCNEKSLINNYNKSRMLQARTFLQKIQDNPELLKEYYSDYSRYIYPQIEELSKSEDGVMVTLGKTDLKISVGDEVFNNETDLLREKDRYKNLVKIWENDNKSTLEIHKKLMCFKDLDFNDYEAVWNAIGTYTTTEREISQEIAAVYSSMEDLLSTLKKLNKKIFKTNAVKEDIEYYEKHVKDKLVELIYDIFYQIYREYKFDASSTGIYSNCKKIEYDDFHSYDSNNYSISNFSKMVNFIKEYFINFDKIINEQNKKITDVKKKIEKYELAASMMKEIYTESAKKKDETRNKIREEIEKKYGVDMDLIKDFLGENMSRTGSTYNKPIGLCLSELDTSIEIIEALEQTKSDITFDELIKSREAIRNYGSNNPNESTGQKIM